MPSRHKDVQLTLNLKTHILDVNSLNYNCLISNLPYLSQLVECAIAQQLSDYMAKYDLHESLYFPYHETHLTETNISSSSSKTCSKHWAKLSKHLTQIVIL